MRAAAIRRFGPESEIGVEELPIPEPGEGQLLLRLSYAGIGSWDAFEREGGYASMLGTRASFPYILGSQGAGLVVEAGRGADRLKPGDPVCATGFLNPKGGFYAEYAVVDEELGLPIPRGYSRLEAAAVLGAGLTALRGLSDALRLRPGETLCVLGASGGVGHLAVQLAAAMGARVVALASGEDGVALASACGAYLALDGKGPDPLDELRARGIASFDKLLLLAGGSLAEELCRMTRPEGAAAFPAGIAPEPDPSAFPGALRFYGEPDREISGRLLAAIEAGGIRPHVDRVFELEELPAAHRLLRGHHLGAMAARTARDSPRG